MRVKYVKYYKWSFSSKYFPNHLYFAKQTEPYNMNDMHVRTLGLSVQLQIGWSLEEICYSYALSITSTSLLNSRSLTLTDY